VSSKCPYLVLEISGVVNRNSGVVRTCGKETIVEKPWKKNDLFSSCSFDYKFMIACKAFVNKCNEGQCVCFYQFLAQSQIAFHNFVAKLTIARTFSSQQPTFTDIAREEF
jgi:hypothetical protein